ncbi:MAG: DUF2092 domain-containing protein [Syntrophobacteraceae bacterium]|jgi:hypothetical protein
MRRTFSFLALFLVLMATITTSSVGARENAPLQRDSKAMSLLEKMASFLARTQHFSVDIRSGYDVVQKSGQKIEFGEIRQIKVNRPAHLRIEIERGNGEKGLVVYNGKDITIYAANDNVYATTFKPGTLDQAIRYAVTDLKIRVPLSVMLLSNFPAEIQTRVIAADYVETMRIADVACDHIVARTADGVDFQVWIAQGDQPLPKRVVITYRQRKGQPQYWADLSNWNLSPDISGALFEFAPPAGAEQIPFLAEVPSVTTKAAPRKGGKK